MQEIHLDVLDLVLLPHNHVAITIQVPSKVVNGVVDMDIAILKRGEDDFIVATTLYEERREEELRVYQGTKAERNEFLIKMGVPPNDPRWREGE